MKTENIKTVEIKGYAFESVLLDNGKILIKDEFGRFVKAYKIWNKNPYLCEGFKSFDEFLEVFKNGV